MCLSSGTEFAEPMFEAGHQYGKGYLTNNGQGYATACDLKAAANKAGKYIWPACIKVEHTRVYGSTLRIFGRTPAGRDKDLTIAGWFAQYKGSDQDYRWMAAITNDKPKETTITDPTIDGSATDGGDASEGTDEGSGESNDLTSGQKKFEEVIKEICDATDTLFIFKKSTLLITDITTLYTRAKHIENNKSLKNRNTIKLWQMEDESFKASTNQYGMYNTVKVKYKNGIVKEYHEKLVSIFGEKVKVYNEPKIDKTSAEIKAKSYLAHHVRDFGMSIDLTALHQLGYDIGDLLWVPNPLTNAKREELFFVSGVSLSLSAEDGIAKNSLELKYGPTNPDNPEIPEVGFGGTVSVGAVDTIIDECIALFKGVVYGGGNGGNADGCTSKGQCDCYGATYTIWTFLKGKGVPCRIYTKEGNGAYSGTHRVCTYHNGTSWVNFPMDKLPAGLGWGSSDKGMCMIKDEKGVQHCSKPTTMGG